MIHNLLIYFVKKAEIAFHKDNGNEIEIVIRRLVREVGGMLIFVG